MKNIGKPCTGKPYARFDEGGQVKAIVDWLLRHRQTKGAETDRRHPGDGWNLSSTLPVYYGCGAFGGGVLGKGCVSGFQLSPDVFIPYDFLKNAPILYDVSKDSRLT